MTFVKLDRGLLSSSLWIEGDAEAVRVWIYLLLSADAHGLVTETLPAIAFGCKLPVDRAAAILDQFAQPDPHSRTPVAEGRRVVIYREPEWSVDIVNYLRYRQKDHTAAERVRRYRQRLAVTRNSRNAGVTDRNDRNALRKQKQKQKQKQNTEGSAARRAAAAAATSATETKRQGLEAVPTVRAVAEAYREAVNRKAVTLGMLEAARRGLDAGATVEDLARIARAVGAARKTPSLAPRGGLLAWALEHQKLDPDYVFRPSNVDKLVTEAEAVLKAAEPQSAAAPPDQYAGRPLDEVPFHLRRAEAARRQVAGAE